MKRILHVLSQRPHLTGSGVTLDALVRNADHYEQDVIVGVPTDDPHPTIANLPPDRVHPLVFEEPVPGMSDVMPYPSTRFSSLDEEGIAEYEARWREHVADVLRRVQPDLIHTHHAWLLSAIVTELAEVPVVVHGHATGLRQMTLCRPEIGARVRAALQHASAFVVLFDAHREQMIETLGVPSDRVHIVGAGYRSDVFTRVGRKPSTPPRVVYAGKLSAAKGVEPMLDAIARIEGVELHIAGDGDAAIRERLIQTPTITWHGMIPPDALANLLRTATVFVLPSMYEGLPLVIVEALACGCRVVATSLAGITKAIAPHTGDAVTIVELPRLEGVDRPLPEDLPGFVTALEVAIREALDAPPLDNLDLTRFTWRAVYDRIETVWKTR